MKTFKRILAYVLTAAMLISILPHTVFAADGDYSITNGYLTYTFNEKTGGFAVETAEGNPKKLLDNNIPLLYYEDRERSNGTSFITVRIGDKDYIFGQDYGFFGLASKLETPQVSDEGRLITIPWTIKGITVTLKVALGNSENSDITGNAGFSFEVENNSGKEENVSVRLLLDTALGKEIDAPYFVVDESIRPTLTETEFKDGNVPQQIRCVDSLSKPSKLSYILTKGWNGGVEANRIIVGHWANLANTRYTYTADEYCDFTNYSNKHREPDGAAALYWENKQLANGEKFTGETLYGVGNFANEPEEVTGLNVTAGKVELSEDKKSYKNDGVIDVTVEIDNTIDGAYPLSSVLLNITLDDKEFTVASGNDQEIIDNIGNEIITRQFKLKAVPQEELTAGTIYVSLTATATLEDGTQKTVETAAQRSVILQSVTGSVPEIQMNKINPDIVWTGGEKAVTVSGKMKAFKALSEDQGWELKLKHTTSNHEVVIEKKNIAFLDDAYENMSFTTKEELEVGKYDIIFEFNNALLKEEFGKSIKCKHQLQVSADEKYKLKSYGTIALVRSGNEDYDFYTFRNEGEYLQFYRGEISKLGEINHKTLKYNFGENKEAIEKNEILLTVRANLREMERGEGENKERYWQAEYGDGDIIINNMLSYEGSKPLEISEKGGEYTVKGDGLLKVVNSINIWRSKWSFSVRQGIPYTLDTERFKKGQEFTLSLDGAATMIQSIGGFLVDLKYGVMSSDWYEKSDGMVTYGIGFGGSISIPIKAPKKQEQKPSLTEDQEDISDAMQNLFDDSDPDDYSESLNNLFNEEAPVKTTKTGEKLKKDTKLSEGQLSAEVNNVLFGEDGDVENGVVKVDKTGFLGIDAKFTLGLPKDVLGSLVSNAPGVYASVTINTIKNVYELEAGLNIKLIECEGVLAFKEVNVKNKDVIVPDKIEFYIREGLKIPLAPPVLFMAGLGGGINELADTIGGEFDKLPPITLLLFTRLEAIETLIGDFNAKISLEGLSLDGSMKLKASDKLLDLEAGISARWIEPWELNLYGKISIIDGLIKGGITINIADNYFYGYIFASICIPDSIPLVGGKELAGVEAAVSHEFIGANIKIIGIKYGVIYYWGKNVSFGGNIDLSPPKKNGRMSLFSLEDADDVTGYYGTNIHAISVRRAAPMLMNNSIYKTASVVVDNAAGQDSLLVEIPYSGSGTPQAGEIILKNPSGKEFIPQADDGNGGGNMLVQNRDGQNYIYVTVTDKDMINGGNGTWTVQYSTENITIDTFAMNGVDDITEVKSCGIKKDTGDFDMTAEWTVNKDSEETGSIDVYLTEDKDILSKIQTEKNNGDALGINILHKTDVKIESGSEAITLPDTFPSGNYYAVTTVSTKEGISLAISENTVNFTNPKLPKAIQSAAVKYAGNGEISVKVTDAENPDYTHYLAEIVDDDGKTVLENNIGQFEKGFNFVFGKEAGLEPDKNYHVNIKTLREEKGKIKPTDEEETTLYFYGGDTVSSNSITIPKPDPPKLLEVKTNFDMSKEFINKSDIVVEYKFANKVFVEMSINGQKAYSDNRLKEDWKFVLDDLEDGDYVIDFTAYTEQKDHITGKDVVSEIPNAQLGFTIDTSAPVLSLAQNQASSVDASKATAVFGSNTILANADGSYTIAGMTERESEFTIDGSGDGITMAENGSFTANRTLAEGESHKEHVLKAVDKAGNESELKVYAIRPGSFSFGGLELQNNGSTIQEVDGIKSITVKNGQSIKLSADIITENGQKTAIDNDSVDWTVLYEKNLISFNSGNIVALAPGETAVKAKVSTSEITNENGGNTTEGLSDYAVIKIENNSKSDLVSKIEEAKNVLQNGSSKSEEKKNALQAAIDSATELLGNSSASESDYTDEVTKLTEAINSFNQSDVRPPSGGGGGGSARMYTITLLPTDHGKAELSHTKAYSGTSVTVKAIPDDGYVVADIIVNGESVGRSEVYTIKSIGRDTEIKVVFAEKSDLPFIDVLESDWFYPTVKGAYENKYMLGITETTFEPNTKLTRAMFVTILHRIDGEPEAGACVFTDVADGTYYEKAVAWANENGIVKGMSETEFDPDAYITREQMSTVLYRYAGYKGIDTSVGKDTNILSYEDYSEISGYAVEAVQWSVGSGLILGKSDTTLNPSDNATRAEAATVFMRFTEMLKK